MSTIPDGVRVSDADVNGMPVSKGFPNPVTLYPLGRLTLRCFASAGHVETRSSGLDRQRDPHGSGQGTPEHAVFPDSQLS